MRVVPVFYHRTYTRAISEESRFPRTRYERVRRELDRRGLAGRHLEVRPPRRATVEELELVHDLDYVQRFLAGDLPADVVRRIGLTPWTDAIVERTLRLTGGTLEAYEQIVDGAPAAGNLAGGTHHAFADGGAGYCVFNDLAICARRALDEGFAERVAVVDLDVHQGDGTAALLADETRVATYSLHCAENFPYRKRNSDRDVDIEEGAGDRRYLERLRSTLPGFLEEFEPEFVLFQSGVDSLACDTHGRLSVTRSGLRQRNRAVFDLVESLDAPVLVTMGGGYGDPIEESARAHADVFELAARRFG